MHEHELDPPVSQLEIERLSTIFLGSLFGDEDARFGGMSLRRFTRFLGTFCFKKHCS